MASDSQVRTPQGDYRARIFAKYATLVHRQPQPVSLEVADAWGKPYESYLRGWLPARNDAAIVDVACGYGRLLRFFAKRGYTDVLGVDISPEEVELARRIHPKVEHANALEFLEAHPGRFDLITGVDIIEHLHKDEILRFLDAALAALRPGGRLVLQTPNGDVPWGFMHRNNDFTHEIAFNPNSLSWVMRLCGFEQFEAREAPPVPHGVLSAVRAALWQLVRLRLALESVIETGSAGSWVYTRVFLASAIRPK